MRLLALSRTMVRCYVLANVPQGAQFEISIYESPDNRDWRRRAAFTVDGYFYVGLGCALRNCTRAQDD